MGSGFNSKSEHESTYTSTSNMHSDPRNIYAPEEFGGPWGQWNLITLDETTGVAEPQDTSTASIVLRSPDSRMSHS